MAEQMISAIMNSIAENWVALGAAFVSLAAAISAASHRRREMRIGWNRELMAWAKDAMLALSEAQMWAPALASMPAEAAQAKAMDVRSRLAASVDQGRLFFENIEGKRPHLLDPLVGVVRLLREYDTHDAHALAAAIDTHRFNFWRRVQGVVDPRWMRKTMQGADVAAGDGADDYATPSRDGGAPAARR